MITLHRLGHAVDTFQINPDAIMTIEATPDTVITILNGQKIVVAEPPAPGRRDDRDLPCHRARRGPHYAPRAPRRAQRVAPGGPAPQALHADRDP